MKRLVAVAFISSICVSAHADMGVFAGVSYVFGSNTGIGFTLQGTSTRKQDHGMIAAGISYYPFAPQPVIGLPVGVGYQGRHGAATINYDFLLKGFSVGAGYANTRDESAPAPVAPAPVIVM